MSARKDVFKQAKQKDRETLKSLTQNVRNHWPDLIISEEHLLNPTTNFVKAFYSRFYSEYEAVTSNIRTNILNQEKKTDQNIYNNDEVSFTIKLKRIVEPLGIPFNLNDICEPQPTRTLTYFIILMNVVIFLKSKTEYTEEIIECVEKKKHLDHLKTSKSILVQNLEDLNEMHTQLGININDLNENIQNLAKEHKDIMMQKAEKDFKYQQDIKTINKLKEEIRISDEHLNKLREESSLLLEQIVSEDEVEKLKSESDDLKKKFNDLDVDASNVVASLKAQEEKNNYYNKCLTTIENSLFTSENLDCLKHQIDKLTALNQQVNKLDETKRSKETELKNLQLEYVNLKKHLEKLQQGFKDLNNKYKNESSKLKDDLNTLISKIKKDEESYRLNEIESENFKETISSLKNDMVSIENNLLAKYEQLMEKRKVFDKFHEVLLNIKKTQS